MPDEHDPVTRNTGLRHGSWHSRRWLDQRADRRIADRPGSAATDTSGMGQNIVVGILAEYAHDEDYTANVRECFADIQD